jgi:hypothetical protein
VHAKNARFLYKRVSGPCDAQARKATRERERVTVVPCCRWKAARCEGAAQGACRTAGD